MSLVKVIRAKLKAGEFRDVFILLQDNKNEALLQIESMDIVSTLTENLTEENLQDDFKLFSNCENLLRHVAGKCSPHEVLFELLEKVELTKNDEIFISLLKVLQIVLLRLNEKKARSLEWSLNAIFLYIEAIELPDFVACIGSDEEKLLECDKTIQRILQLYMTVLLFLKPIIKVSNRENSTFFESTGLTRKSIVICFILQLMGKPLVYLNVHCPTSNVEKSGIHGKVVTKTYSRQVAEDLVSALSDLLGDPYRLLQYGERRLRWPSKVCHQTEGVFEETSLNIFKNEEKCPLLSLGMYHYLIIGENILPNTAPTIYSHRYISEMSLYYCTLLMGHDQTVVHYKGILLAKQLLAIMGSKTFSSENLDVAIHQKFCKALSKLIIYSTIERNRKEGTFLLRDYIYQFDQKGRYLLITNLFHSIHHSGLHSYVATIYKDLLLKELSIGGTPCEWYVGKPLKSLLLNEICILNKGVKTDLIENADTVISGLNILRYLLIRDKNNQTSIWNCITEIEESFLKPLRKSIDLARAHFKHEQSVVEKGSVNTNKPEFDLTIAVLNGEQFPELTKEKKIEMLTQAMNTFDLMECLLARVTECLNSKPKLK